MANGWIKVHRGMLEHGIFQDGELLRLWMYLLLKATYRELDLPVGRQVVHLEPGQLLYGRQAVSQKLDIGEYQLRKMMAQLEQFGSLTIESHSRYSVVTITNWVQYQQEQGKPEFPFDVDFLDEPENEDDEITLEELMELERQMWGEPDLSFRPERSEVEKSLGSLGYAQDDEAMPFRPGHCRRGYQPPATEVYEQEKNRQLGSPSASGLEDNLNNNFTSKAPTENHKQEEKNNNKIINKDKNKKRKNIKIKRNITELKQNKKREEKNKTKE